MKRTILAAGVVAAAAGLAGADAISSFGFINLDGEFDAGTSRFTATATDGAFRTSGEVNKLIGSMGTARFAPGFASGGTQADVEIEMDISNITGSSADGSGSFTITDADGDTLTGRISGQWLPGVGGFTFFNGELSNIMFNDISGNNEFAGPTGGSFSFNGLGGTYEGAMVNVFVDAASGFFSNSFSGVAVQSDGVIIPAPAGAALLGLGGLLAVRRRRR